MAAKETFKRRRLFITESSFRMAYILDYINDYRLIDDLVITCIRVKSLGCKHHGSSIFLIDYIRLEAVYLNLT